MLNTFGFDMYFGLVIQKCKFDADELGGKENLTEFILTKAEAASLKYTGEDEFKMNGRLYDIVKRENSGDKVRLFCFDDENETRALEEYNSLTKDDENPVSSRNAGYVLNNLIRNYIAPAGLRKPLPVRAEYFIKYLETSYSTASIQINLPPPKSIA